MGKERKSSQPIRNVSWEEFDSLSKRLIEQIPHKIVRRYGGTGELEYASIWGVPRGGLWVALRLSYLQPKFAFKDFSWLASRGGYLVDDVLDSGKTIKNWMKNYGIMPSEEVKIASLFYRHSSEVVPDYYVEELEDNTWIIFPWEKE